MSSDLNKSTNKSTTVDEERFRALVIATSDVVYRMSPDWQELQELKGRGFLTDTTSATTKWIDRYIHPKDQHQVLDKIREAIENKTIFELEHQILRADGTLGWTFCRAVPIFDENRQIVEWFGTATDITAKKQIEDELRAAREESETRKRLYEAITGNTPDLIYVFDLEYHFTYANQALLNMWGLSWEQAAGKRLLEVGYEPWHAAMHEREIDEISATRRSIRGEVSFPHAVLGKRIYDYILVPVLNAEGKVEAVAGTTRDITEIRMAEDAIRRSREELETLVIERTKALSSSNDDLQRFAHVASHDMKEPIRKIRIFIDCLKLECGKGLNEKANNFLNRIDHAATRMSSLIDGVLSYAKFQGNQEEAVQVDLDSVLLNVETDLEMIIQQKQADIYYKDLGKIKGYPILLSQLFYNLLANSLKFSRAGVPPVIEIAAKTLNDDERQKENLDASKPYTQIIFRDNGIGFKDENAETIFQTFSRLNSKDHYDGTGIGLTLCRKITERHGGKIKATGEENRGSLFTIFLPQN